mmetsp:Transcript_17930/g.71869  ORF Transcript_17930/g.71869 Transcript_17930/m.71869 type:complete len:221 (+) Transcript_17930:724-1386(+)
MSVRTRPPSRARGRAYFAHRGLDAAHAPVPASALESDLRGLRRLLRRGEMRVPAAADASRVPTALRLPIARSRASQPPPTRLVRQTRAAVVDLRRRRDAAPLQPRRRGWSGGSEHDETSSSSRCAGGFFFCLFREDDETGSLSRRARRRAVGERRLGGGSTADEWQLLRVVWCRVASALRVFAVIGRDISLFLVLAHHIVRLCGGLRFVFHRPTVGYAYS